MKKDELVIIALESVKHLIDIHNSSLTENAVRTRIKSIVDDLNHAYR